MAKQESFTAKRININLPLRPLTDTDMRQIKTDSLPYFKKLAKAIGKRGAVVARRAYLNEIKSEQQTLPEGSVQKIQMVHVKFNTTETSK